MLVDDHPITRMGFASILNAQEGLRVSAEAADCEGALRQLAASRPDLLVTDLSMPGRGGLELIEDSLALYPGLPILVVSLHEEEYQAEKALRAGALGYMMKDAGVEKILEAVWRVLGGEIYLNPALSARLLDFSSRKSQTARTPIENLTERQFQIFKLLGLGLDSKRIARRLRLSFKTVDAHRDQMKRKLKLPDGAALNRRAAHWVKTQAQAESRKSAAEKPALPLAAAPGAAILQPA